MKTSLKALFSLALITPILLMAGGCGNSDKPSASTGATDSKGGGGEFYKPTSLKVGIIPSDDTEKIISQFEKLRGYLETSLKMKVTVLKLTSYAAVIEAMKHKKIDSAWFAPASYVIAETEANAEPIAVREDSKGASGYFSEIIVPANSSIADLKGLQGKKLTLVEASSTSGGLVPSYMILQATGTPVEKLCTVTYAGSHDSVINLVKGASVDAGATNNLTIGRLIEEHKLTEADFKVIAKSDPLPDSPLCCRKDLDPGIKEAFWKALQDSAASLGTYSIAGIGEIAKYKKVTPADFQMIRDIRDKLKVSNETLLK
jgi:phosphonate transport system substrate-binding protein